MQTLAERFWSKVDRRGADQCWPWTGARDARGYGSIHHDGRRRRATQVSWSLANGEAFPEGKCACHTCDNPPCVNPAHLWPGTVRENALDAKAKGRLATNYGRVGCFLTQCQRGHPMSGENVAMTAKGRICRACAAMNKKEWKARLKAAAREEMSNGFMLKPFVVSVDGFGQSVYPAASRGKALAAAWRSYTSCYNSATFKDFLKIARARQGESPARFGDAIKVGGMPAFYVGENGQYVRFVRPGETEIYLSHPADVAALNHGASL